MQLKKKQTIIFKVIFNHLAISLGNTLPRYQYFNRIRPKLYRLAGLNIGSGTTITGPLSLRADTTHKIFIGKNTYFNSETRFGCQDSTITIGNNVLIGPRVSFESASHNVLFEEGKGRGFFTKEIVIQDKAWIGAGVIILPGVTVGEGAVVAAGAVVNKDVKQFTLVGGVPARIIKEISSFKQLI
jgi:maltose O-acetyltransferase